MKGFNYAVVAQDRNNVSGLKTSFPSTECAVSSLEGKLNVFTRSKILKFLFKERGGISKLNLLNC
jgi:hypothetical protein